MTSHPSLMGRNADASASETTGLLANMEHPSAHSTDSPTPRSYSSEALPLVSSYEDLRQSVERQLEELTNASKSRKESVFPSSRILTRRHALLILLCACALTLLGVGFFVSQARNNVNDDGRRNHPSSGGHVDSMPFSLLDPVTDLKLASYDRPEATKPPKELFVGRHHEKKPHRPLPTNAWYQNLLLLRGEPSNIHRVYSTPYLLDLVGQIPGLRMHRTRVLSSDSVLQLTFNDQNGLTLGADVDMTTQVTKKEQQELSHVYRVLETTKLGLTLQWTAMDMISTIVKGMPYTTMEYNERNATVDGDLLLPTIHSPFRLAKEPRLDGTSDFDCSKEGAKAFVKREMELEFFESDFTWMVFFSKPVWLQCSPVGGTSIQVLDRDNADSGPLIVRAALLSSCTTGTNAISCMEAMGDRLPEEKQVKEYRNILRHYSRFYPGRKTSVSYTIEDEAEIGELVFDWDVQTMPDNLSEAQQEQATTRLNSTVLEEPSLITYALPHHLDILGSSHRPAGIKYCMSSLNGPTCLVEGSTWTLREELPRIGLQAARLPKAEFLSALSDALEKDIEYSLPAFFERGAGDTYFSGKMLSKLGRILLIAEELMQICGGKLNLGQYKEDYEVACKNVTLPTKAKYDSAIDRLRRSVEVWINGTAETPFVYDEAWGGVVSCGCLFDGKKCENHYPDCPAFSDQGLNFGNAFYNDQHFHYGYHIHGAAIVAHFDPDWGKAHFEQVLLLIRNIANPSEADSAFPLFRHKDWYQGSSWASGVPLPPYLNGKNQESTSEAIAAYESVALFGQVMTRVWGEAKDEQKVTVSREVFKVGQLMTATELRSAKKYWHIKHKNPDEQIVPKAYTANVIGILWSTMAQFGTWFGAAPYLPYGIQLLPLTPISEERDELEWVNEMYYPFSRACADFHQCTESGWAILQLAILATVGYAEHAADRVKELLPDSYENAGGNGQSKSNTIWYIATRPFVLTPVAMDQSDVRGHEEIRPLPTFVLSDCHTPITCTSDILDRQAGLYTCRARIDWLIHSEGNAQWEACSTVGAEFEECQPCSPVAALKNATDSASSSSNHQDGDDDEADSKHALQCGQCTLEQCNSDFNRCPASERTFVCTSGTNRGGCSSSPWTLGHEQCHACCEMTYCQKLKDEEAKKVTNDGNALVPTNCPPCEPSVCYGKVNQCPLHTAPYLCLDGYSVGGCRAVPWNTHSIDGQCTKCCEITVTC